MKPFEIVQAPQHHLAPRVWFWCESFRTRVFDDYAPQTMQAFCNALQSRLMDAIPYWIHVAGEIGDVGGLVLMEYARPGVWSSHVLFKRSFWGREITEASLREVYRQFFEEHPECRRIESMVFSDNSAIIGLARKLGARVEGTMREYTMRQGKPADMVSVGLIRAEFIGLESGSFLQTNTGE